VRRILRPCIPLEVAGEPKQMIYAWIKPRRKPRPGRLKGFDLKLLRFDCFVRDEWKCVECKQEIQWERGYTNSGHMAHIGAKRRHGDSLENVRTLCPACHHAEHNPKACPKKVCVSNEA
jgi:5-methylcytosine-specific restriction endonuclease McrA